MRAAMESLYVTQNIYHWIDLVFGQKNKKSTAIKYDNLFPSTVYDINMKKLSKSDRESLLVCYKEFGQNPKCLFETNHTQFFYSLMQD